MVMSVQNKVRRARLASALQNCKRERAFCRPTLITPNRVEFAYGGYTVVFVYDKGRIARIGDNRHYVYLSEEDYAILFTMASDLMQASFNGVKKDKKGPVHIRTSTQLELPLAGLPHASTH